MMSGNLEQVAKNQPWSDFEQWNMLFEALCETRGFTAVNDLAHAYCRRMRRQTQRDLDAAVRSINNWRAGSHAPSARNLAVLAQILEVSSDPALHEAWQTLYRRAKGQPNTASSVTAQAPSRDSRITTLVRGMRWRRPFLIAVSALVVAFVVGYAFRSAGDRVTASASAEPQQLIPYRPTVILAVGQRAVIHGYRAECGRPAPDKDETTSILPSKIGIGTLIAGNTGVRYSRHCGGNTPAREVILHAEHAGSDKIELFGDVISIAVTE